MLHNCLIDSEGSTYILNYCSNIDRDGWRSRNLTVDNGINQLFFTTLRVALGQGNHLNLVFRGGERFGTLFGEEVDGGRLIGLDADIALCHLRTLHQQFQTHENLVGMFHHQTVVGCDIGLALYGVDNHALSLGRRGRGQFDERGETGTAHTDDTSRLDACHNLLGRQFRMILHQFQRLGTVNALFPFVAFHVDDNHGLAIAGSVDSGINLGNRTTHGRVDGS